MTQIDTEQRISALVASAEAGDRESQFQLGLAYEAGDGVPYDEQLATLWFKRAAQQEHPDALLHYGDALYYGRGVSKDLPKSFAQYLRGANLGNLGCQFAVGFAYFNGEGVETDEKLAEMWYLRAADLGNADAQLHYGFMHENGSAGLPIDYELAAKWYRKAAAQGVGKAMKAMGLLYLRKGDDEYEYDPLEALYWFKKGADAGDATCMCYYGKLLTWDEGIPQNLPEGVMWLRKGAVKLQDPWSAELLALSLNWLDPNNSPEVFYWNARYCLQTDPTENAASLMASCYEWQSTQTGSVDAASLALWWWDIAQERGASYAQDHIPKCLDAGGTRERAKEIFAERRLKEEDIVNGVWIIPLNTDEPAINGDNMPVPYAVREEMGEAFEAPPSPPGRTEPLQQEALAEQPTQQTRQAPQAVPNEELKPAPPSSDPFAGLHDLRVTQLPAGSILADKFLIEKVLGRGGMAIVFKAKQLLMDRSVAIKMMLPEVAKDKTTAQRFQREAKNASRLRHPNVITIYDYGVTPEGQPFIVMDYLQGNSLEDILEQERMLSLSRGLTILTQVCDALGHAHQEGIVHRDIKPSNIMIERRRAKDHVLLVDFGIAKALGEQSEQQQKLTKTGEVFGSLVYMSPEQCMGKPLDARSDVYAFGCVFFEVFCGSTPFLGETVFETMTKHIYDAPPIMDAPGVTDEQRSEMNAVFQKCVAKSPEARYQSMDEVKDALLAIP